MVRLLVLGLLMRRPSSGYEIQQILQTSRIDMWTDVLPGSIYHALKKMTTEGLLEVQSTEQTGFRTKAIYAITDAGRTAFSQLLRDAWRTPARALPTDLYAALAFVDDLPRAELVALINEQIARLEEQLAQWNAGAAAKAQAVPLPPYLEAAFENGRIHFETDLSFLRYLRETLPSTPVASGEMPAREEGAPE